MQLRRPGVPALLAGHAAEHLQAARDAPGVAELAVQPERGLEPAHRGRVVALQQREPAAAQQRLGAQRGGRAVARRHGRVHPLPDLVIPAAQVGVAVQRAGDPQRRHRVAGLQGELERPPQVRQLGVQPVELAGLASVRGAPASSHQLGEVLQVRAADLVALARLGQPVPRVVPDGGEQRVARAAAAVLHPQQRLVRQPGQQLQHRARPDVTGSGDPFGGRRA